MMMMMQARKQSNDVSGVEKNMKTKKKSEMEILAKQNC